MHHADLAGSNLPVVRSPAPVNARAGYGDPGNRCQVPARGVVVDFGPAPLAGPVCTDLQNEQDNQAAAVAVAAAEAVVELVRVQHDGDRRVDLLTRLVPTALLLMLISFVADELAPTPGPHRRRRTGPPWSFPLPNTATTRKVSRRPAAVAPSVVNAATSSRSPTPLNHRRAAPRPGPRPPVTAPLSDAARRLSPRAPCVRAEHRTGTVRIIHHVLIATGIACRPTLQRQLCQVLSSVVYSRICRAGEPPPTVLPDRHHALPSRVAYARVQGARGRRPAGTVRTVQAGRHRSARLRAEGSGRVPVPVRTRTGPELAQPHFRPADLPEGLERSPAACCKAKRSSEHCMSWVGEPRSLAQEAMTCSTRWSASLCSRPQASAGSAAERAAGPAHARTGTGIRP